MTVEPMPNAAEERAEGLAAQLQQAREALRSYHALIPALADCANECGEQLLYSDLKRANEKADAALAAAAPADTDRGVAPPSREGAGADLSRQPRAPANDLWQKIQDQRAANAKLQRKYDTMKGHLAQMQQRVWELERAPHVAALDLLATETHESGQEIAELIEERRAATAPATTLIEYECDHGGRFYARYANGEVLPTGVTIRAFAGKSHITPKRYAEIIPAAGAAPNETEQT